MKKILSVMLAIMMIFGAMAINVSAAEAVVPATTNDIKFGSTITANGEAYTITSADYVIVQLDFGNGKSLEGLYVYNVGTTPGFVYTDGVTGKYLMLPYCSPNCDLTPGGWIHLPAVGAPEGQTCQGWEIRGTGTVVGHGIDWQIPAGTQGRVLELVARYTTAEPEEDTMALVLGVLMKVFGTIIGILFMDGNSAGGVELMQKLLGGIMG